MSVEPVEAMVEWLQDKFFSLLNVHNYPIFHHHNHLHHSVCDLTGEIGIASQRASVPRITSADTMNNINDCGIHVGTAQVTHCTNLSHKGSRRAENSNWDTFSVKKFESSVPSCCPFLSK